MSTETAQLEKPRPTAGARRFGYMVAIVINVIMLVVVNNILEWGWFSFLTEDFESMIPLINISLVATILANGVYLAYDPAWFKSSSQMVLNLISLIVTIRMYQVFPFDFSASQFDWEPIVRVVIILGIVGTGLAVVVELVKATRALVQNRTPETR